MNITSKAAFAALVLAASSASAWATDVVRSPSGPWTYIQTDKGPECAIAGGGHGSTRFVIAWNKQRGLIVRLVSDPPDRPEIGKVEITINDVKVADLTMVATDSTGIVSQATPDLNTFTNLLELMTKGKILKVLQEDELPIRLDGLADVRGDFDACVRTNNPRRSFDEAIREVNERVFEVRGWCATHPGADGPSPVWRCDPFAIVRGAASLAWCDAHPGQDLDACDKVRDAAK